MELARDAAPLVSVAITVTEGRRLKDRQLVGTFRSLIRKRVSKWEIRWIGVGRFLRAEGKNWKDEKKAHHRSSLHLAIL